MPLSCDCQSASIGLHIRPYSTQVSLQVSKQIIMQIFGSRYLALLPSIQFWAIALTVTLPAQMAPAPILNYLITPNSTISHTENSPPNDLPPDPYTEDFLGGLVKFSDYGSKLSHRDVNNCIFQLYDVLERHQSNKKGRVGIDVRHYDSGNVRLSLHPKPSLIWEDLTPLYHYLLGFYRKWDYVALQFGVNKPRNAQVMIGFFSAIGAEE